MQLGLSRFTVQDGPWLGNRTLLLGVGRPGILKGVMDTRKGRYRFLLTPNFLTRVKLVRFMPRSIASRRDSLPGTPCS